MSSSNNITIDASSRQGTSLNSFLGALTVSVIIFAVQVSIFFLLRNKLARILFVQLSSPPVTATFLTSAVLQQAQDVPGAGTRANRTSTPKSSRPDKDIMELQ
jgi:hypothetical protein